MATATALAPSATSTLTIPQKLDLLRARVEAVVYERTDEIECAILALIGRLHHVSIGGSGEGKTYLVTTLTNHIAFGPGGYFWWLMDKATTKDDLYGLISFTAMKNDTHRRNTTGKMPEADVVFLDEYFKGNNGVNNTQLTILNEGKFMNDGVPMDCRPVLFGASNELPNGVEMFPLWDRIPFRFKTKPVQNRDNKLKMRRAKAARNRAGTKVPVEAVITWDEILIARAGATMVEIPDEVYDALIDLEVKLNEKGIEPTQRRLDECITVIQAAAYWRGSNVADLDDMRPLRHVLWLTFEQIPVVEKLVFAIASPMDLAASKLIAEVDVVAEEFAAMMKSTDNETQRRKLGVQLNKKMARLGTDLENLQDKAKSNNKRSTMLSEARARLHELMNALLALYK
jgi:MoxR-like ATPase